MKTNLLSRNAIIVTSLSIVAISTLIFSSYPSNNEKKSCIDDLNIALLINANSLIQDGKNIFRFETFGDEAFWTNALQLNKSIAGKQNGGVGPGLPPATALMLGLKVDMDALPANVLANIKAGKVNLNDPAVTILLLKLNAVVGVKGKVTPDNKLSSVGITCALCHSTVDNAFTAGIGHRLDGWANRDLNVGAIIAFAPNLTPFVNALQVNEATVRKVLLSWGPGKFDAELNLDGKAFRPDGKPAATLIPPAFGMLGVNNHTWTGGWGTVTYWNAFVANLEMHGQGNFYDVRLNNAKQYPVAARLGLGNVRTKNDLITSKLSALQYYQLSLLIPDPPKQSFDNKAANRGKLLFAGKGKCAVCHVVPIFTEPGWNTHKASKIGIDDFQANRSPDSSYRTSPLRGLWTHTKGGFFHDGRFATLLDVVNHFNRFQRLRLSEAEKKDIVEYLKSLGGDNPFAFKAYEKSDASDVSSEGMIEKAQGVKFYPNPANNILNIQRSATTDNAPLNIYNNLGQLVKSSILSDSDTQIDISDLSPGIYILLYDGKELGKFIKE